MKRMRLYSSGTTLSNIDFSSLILRLAAGSFMIYGHGAGKFTKFFSEEPIEFINPFGIGAVATLGLVVFAEIICSLLVILGLMTRYALIPLMITMLYAVFVAHGDDPFRQKEMGLLYFFIFLALMLIGPGKYSLDRMIKKRRKTV